MENNNYTEIRRIILDEFKGELKRIATAKNTGYAGDGYYSPSRLKEIVSRRKNNSKAAKSVIKLLKTLGY